mmetsp:Transcript_3533/g.5254  ORF Transcript_3533/g.5254 Transcript_3533/m.5254 type:complete len:355 (-) Transcript_3533:976-2040(-)
MMSSETNNRNNNEIHEQFVIPTIYLDDEEGNQDAAALRLRSACMDVGFFYLERHGVPSELLSRVLAASKAFFHLPVVEKAKLTDPILNRGYTHLGEETLDPRNQPVKGDTKEGFYIGRDVPSTSEKFNTAKLTGPNVWPTPEYCSSWTEIQCEDFRRTMQQYFDAMSTLGLKVVQQLALAIGLPTKHFFDKSFAEPMAMLRLLHYSSEPSCPMQGVFGCGAHSDYGMITLLLTDDQRGLQIFTKEQKWVDVPPRNEAFIVNLGDMLERWTNGLFRSTIHRVLIVGDAEDSNKNQNDCQFKDRYSIPFFYEPNFDTEVRCLEECCKDREPRYPPTTSGKYLLQKYEQTHADFSPR